MKVRRPVEARFFIFTLLLGGNIGIYDCDLQYEKPVLLKAHGG